MVVDLTTQRTSRVGSICLLSPENTVALLKYVAAWEKETMSKLVIRQINTLLKDWKSESGEV